MSRSTICLLLMLCGLSISSVPYAQNIDEIRKNCVAIGIVDKAALLVPNLHVSAPAYMTSGYVQVLGFETSGYGHLECVFKFKTKPYTDPKGVKIPSMKIEGRFRASGAYHTR